MEVSFRSSLCHQALPLSKDSHCNSQWPLSIESLSNTISLYCLHILIILVYRQTLWRYYRLEASTQVPHRDAWFYNII